MKSQTLRNIQLIKQQDGYSITFDAMASPCEVLIQTTDKKLALKVGKAVADEVWRIQDKYSRYIPNSICSQINTQAGNKTAIDSETYLLLQFAEQCYQLSDGLFDITSGVLRQIWRFDGSDNIPTDEQVQKIMLAVGWQKIEFNQQHIILAKNMEIDFGGIGKEYAVDRSILLVKQLTNKPTLVNLGGDLCATSSRQNNQPWQVGIENPVIEAIQGESQKMIVSLMQGALATSGDAKRYLLKNGKRYSHILNALTGRPIDYAPSSMTVVAPQCIQAGILATLALLQGENAEQFLDEQEVKYWAVR